MEDSLRDLKRALRVLLHNPAFTLAALAALALGIGANTAIFSIVNTVLLKPLNVPDADRTVQFMLNYPGISYPGGSPHQFYFWRQQTDVVQDVSALRLELLNLVGSGEPRQITVARVNAEFFHLFGVTLASGRFFNSDEDRPGGRQVAVLSHALWTDKFGGNPGVIGQTLSLSGESYIVIGILGPGFKAEEFDEPPEILIPYQMNPNSTEGDCYCRVVARLKSGITLSMANAKLKLAADDFRRVYPGPGDSHRGFSLMPLKEALIGNVRPLLLMLAGAVGLVLLIACTNVASLLLVRANAGRREIAIRAAMGACRSPIIRLRAIFEGSMR